MEEKLLHDIEYAIQRKREEMEYTAKQLGLTHELTIQNSQDLDRLLNIHLVYTKKQKSKKAK